MKSAKLSYAIDKEFIRECLTYYKAHGRHELPWRKRITAYKILVSEIMLQQTQVARVLPKYTLWMKRFPTLRALQGASLQELLILWQGLGYQRRCKALYAIAKEHKTLPKHYNELLKLPGIGVYTSSAICAFAYNRFDHPLLETNIRTALIEYYFQAEESVHDGMLYDVLDRLVTCKEVQDIGARGFYYAVMDFGAYLKSNRISHNAKSAHYSKQSAYKGSFRELRAKVLFAITHHSHLPSDPRVNDVLDRLVKEGYITTDKQGVYVILN